jgi:hypothetical protein
MNHREDIDMRSLPRTTRVAVANVILNYRAMRERSRDMKTEYGDGHVMTQVATQRMLQCHSDYGVMKLRIRDEVSGELLRTRDGHAFLKLATDLRRR